MNASETEQLSDTAYIYSSLEYTMDYKLVLDRFANQGKYVQGVLQQQTPKGWNHTSPEITLIGSNQRNYIENTNACSKRKLKTRVATRL